VNGTCLLETHAPYETHAELHHTNEAEARQVQDDMSAWSY